MVTQCDPLVEAGERRGAIPPTYASHSPAAHSPALLYCLGGGADRIHLLANSPFGVFDQSGNSPQIIVTQSHVTLLPISFVMTPDRPRLGN